MFTVLCIGDVNFVEVQKSGLETKGYAVVTASDGPTGITLASKRAFDVVVLAFKLPGIDGGQVAEVLLKQQPGLPIVICTALFDAVPEWLRWCADACVEKRDGPDVLLSTIEKVIAHKKMSVQAVAA